MSTNLDDLDPYSPEYEAAMEAAQDAEDAALGNATTASEEEEADPEAKADEPTAVVEAEATAAEPAAVEAAPQPKVAGVASKDGSRVLPYAALQAERRAARHERGARERAEAELAAAKELIEDLKAGKTPEPDPLSDEALAEIAQELPEVDKLVKERQALRDQVAELKGKVAPTTPAEPEVDPAEALQEAIDSVPLLSEWQATDPEKFSRAVEIDRVMQNSPKWAGKPIEARFAHVAKQVADEYDIPFEDAPQPTTPTPNKADPREVISKAARAAPNTLSDFKGGAVDQSNDRLDRIPAARAVARMADMTDEEIDAHLAKFG